MSITQTMRIAHLDVTWTIDRLLLVIVEFESLPGERYSGFFRIREGGSRA